MNSKFIILNKCYWLIEYMNPFVTNLPRNERLLKDAIEKNHYELIESLFAYNINVSNKLKAKFMRDFLIKLSMLDYYTKVMHVKKLIKKKKLEVVGNKIHELKRIAQTLLNNVSEGDK